MAGFWVNCSVQASCPNCNHEFTVLLSRPPERIMCEKCYKIFDKNGVITGAPWERKEE